MVALVFYPTEIAMPRSPQGARHTAAEVPTRWFAALNIAEDASEVVEVTNQYLHSWTPPELLRIPYWCRPGKVSTATQIEELASLLDTAQRNFVGRLVDAMVLDRMLQFFQEAARKLSQLTTSTRSVQYS